LRLPPKIWQIRPALALAMNNYSILDNNYFRKFYALNKYIFESLVKYFIWKNIYHIPSKCLIIQLFFAFNLGDIIIIAEWEIPCMNFTI
jgi:hypothetical protein